ncbi:transposase family protein [Streptomyces sp. NPDC096538]|uniref:transposase family protein n=1 Tax=Streptomyces sp. NPDC096538 TaxID=3155427 RepID=UPI003332ADAB
MDGPPGVAPLLGGLLQGTVQAWGPARRAGRPARAASGGRWTRTQHVVAAGHFGQARATGGTTPGKHRSHGLHFLVLTDEKGRLIWTSAARPGLGHDNTAARHDHILARLRTAGLGALADRPRQRHPRPVIVTGYTASRTHKLTSGAEKDKRILAVGRAPVAQGSVHLKNWRALTKLRSDPARATRLLRASLVLTNLEVNR